MAPTQVLGVDIGSVSVAAAVVGEVGAPLRWAYAEHKGRLVETVRQVMSELQVSETIPAAITASSPKVMPEAYPVDWLSSHIACREARFPDSNSLLVVGGERFALVRFNPDGSYRSSRMNSGCAAGTGGFLDQQARRLGLGSAADLATTALAAAGKRPRIASRCAVFAKTDLIHAQQEGYALPEICDGLCEGLARNLLDALGAGDLPPGPILACGGVAWNTAVIRHVEEISGRPVEVPEWAPAVGAVGAAEELLRARRAEVPAGASATACVAEPTAHGENHHAPLVEPRDYPSFSDHESWAVQASVGSKGVVEVDRYAVAGPSAAGHPAPSGFVGIDIGSTSTKAVVTNDDGEPLWAFYTRTAGKPLMAVQAVFAAMDQVGALVGPPRGVATTGSGRNFIGRIVGADLILDEITAHARAATKLNPATDTIIEIGGQDAKFTTLRDGRVTFSQMNTVCAAGTGSFLEEQAERLGVSVDDYADRCLGVATPLASDRCTVFMERDINHLISAGYSTDQILTTALHSVRENYLQKVAERSSIGKHLCFQGATAKNRALVAAFEQALGVPIAVSRYCHVTGALGAALVCRDEGVQESGFVGLGLASMDVPVGEERCELCKNHCRIRTATVAGNVVKYGFLCGRDQDSTTYISANKSGFDLAASRRRVFRDALTAVTPRGGTPRGGGARRVLNALRHDSGSGRKGPSVEAKTVGLPTGLHLAEENLRFQRFFAELGITTVTPKKASSSVSTGKKVEGAEFCAPVAAYHGQVAELLTAADLVFVPYMLEREATTGEKKSYCYYTQFSPTLLESSLGDEAGERLLRPALYAGRRDPVDELYAALAPHFTVGLREVAEAWRTAEAAVEKSGSDLRRLYLEYAREDQVDVVLLGRPYTALDPSMNKGIPLIFEKLGVRVFFQDMLPIPSSEARGVVPNSRVHWRYAGEMVTGAEYCAKTPGLYPVFVTSFKCAPDSFTLDSCKTLLERQSKPYLVLQLDEHDSNLGYETRIEAAVRAFRNHFALRSAGRDATLADLAKAAQRRRASGNTGSSLPGDTPSGGEKTTTALPRLNKRVGKKTLLLPNWDPVTVPLLAANLRSVGVDAVALPTSQKSVRRSMRHNSGQCLPVNIIAEDALEYVRASGRPAADFVLWMVKADWSCGIPRYPAFIKELFAKEGLGRLGVYVGDVTYIDLKPRALIGAYFAYQFGGWLRLLTCRTRPYEKEAGSTDRVATEVHSRLLRAFESGHGRKRALRHMVEAFASIPVNRTERPKVALFGDLYVRDNDVMNGDLIRTIEAAGGEAVTTPYSDYIKIIASAQFAKLRKERDVAGNAKYRVLASAIERVEKSYRGMVEPYLGPSLPWSRAGSEADLSRFGMIIEQHGESYENILKIMHLVDYYDDIALFVQASPAFCCPSLVTEALADTIQATIGVPVVTVTYDGTEGDKNAAIIPYIKYAQKRAVSA